MKSEQTNVLPAAVLQTKIRRADIADSGDLGVIIENPAACCRRFFVRLLYLSLSSSPRIKVESNIALEFFKSYCGEYKRHGA